MVRFKEQYLQHFSIITILELVFPIEQKKTWLVFLYIMKKVGQKAFGISLLILVNNLSCVH